MLKQRALAASVVCLLSFSIFISVNVSFANAQESMDNGLLAAVNYLVANYDASVGLVHESPDSQTWKRTYWIYSDNYLVQLALEPFSANQTIQTVTENISETSKMWIATQAYIVNQYQVLNTSTVFPFNNAQNYILTTSQDAAINCTINNSTGTLDPAHYADVAFLEAIAYHNRGEDANALTAYSQGVALWDGSGFRDDAFDGTYATYKNALYILASKTLNQTYNPQAYNNLVACQLNSGVDAGGFATSYVENGTAASGTNTETTALAILALNMPVTPEFSNQTFAILFTAIALSTLTLAVVLKRKKRF